MRYAVTNLLRGVPLKEVISSLLESDAEQRELQRRGMEGDPEAVKQWTIGALRQHGEPSPIRGTRYLRLGTVSTQAARSTTAPFHSPERAAVVLRAHDLDLMRQAQNPLFPYPVNPHKVEDPQDTKFAYLRRTSTPAHQSSKLKQLRKEM